jgi:excisionase family DNA binding protein
MSDESVVMTAEEVADFLGLGRNQVYEAAARGELPARRVGRRWLFLRDALVSWLKGKSAEGRKGKPDAGIPR